MATDAKSATTTATKLNLNPPEPLQTVQPSEAAGLVPLKQEETSELHHRLVPRQSNEPPHFQPSDGRSMWFRRIL